MTNGRTKSSSAAFLAGRRFASRNRLNFPVQHRSHNLLSMTAETPSALSSLPLPTDSVDGICNGVQTSGDHVAAATQNMNSMMMLAAESSPVFEPTLPNTSALVAMGSVLVLCVIAAFVWANEVVPVSRTKLAISKSRGEVKEYLDALKEGADLKVETSENEGSESTATSAAMTKAEDGVDRVTKPNVGDGRDFERWLFSDWLNSTVNRKAGRQKEPAVPILKDAKWNSGDNPVLVTSAMIGLGVIIASVTERVVR